jgi:hypothetical protein
MPFFTTQSQLYLWGNATLTCSNKWNGTTCTDFNIKYNNKTLITCDTTMSLINALLQNIFELMPRKTLVELDVNAANAFSKILQQTNSSIFATCFKSLDIISAHFCNLEARDTINSLRSCPYTYTAPMPKEYGIGEVLGMMIAAGVALTLLACLGYVSCQKCNNWLDAREQRTRALARAAADSKVETAAASFGMRLARA